MFSLASKQSTLLRSLVSRAFVIVESEKSISQRCGSVIKLKSQAVKSKDAESLVGQPAKSAHPNAKLKIGDDLKYGNMQSGLFFNSRNLFKWLAEKVGTDLKEVRLNFNYFRQNVVNIPFAIIQINEDAFENKSFVKELAESLAFLHQNEMNIMIVVGARLVDSKAATGELNEQKTRFENLTMDMMLEFANYSLKAMPIFNGNRLFNCELAEIDKPFSGRIVNVNSDLVDYCFRTSQIPIINSMGQTNNYLTALDINHVTSSLALKFKPFKIINLNLRGGLRDKDAKLLLNVNIPNQPAEADAGGVDAGCRDVSFEHANVTFDEIRSLMTSMPRYASYVITRVEDMIAELFTNVGRGTFFKLSERLIVTRDLAQLDQTRLKELIEQSFNKKLRDCYFEKLAKRNPTIYITENYSALAIVTKDLDNYAYLDKLCVTAQYQGHGLSDLIWSRITSDYKGLYWRSRKRNPINSWYFRHAQGSWQTNTWIFFWYGLDDPNLSSKIIDYANKLENSFENNNNSGQL